MYNGGGPFYDSFPMNKDLFEYSSLYEGLKIEHPEVVDFINGLDLYKETENIVFVHAGVVPDSLSWQDDYDNCLWIREEFLYNTVLEKRRIVFGHTPTRSLNEYMSDDEVTANFNKLKGTEFTSKEAIENGANINQPWIKDNKLGIDGGSVNRGRLNAILLNNDGVIKDYFFV